MNTRTVRLPYRSFSIFLAAALLASLALSFVPAAGRVQTAQAAPGNLIPSAAHHDLSPSASAPANPAVQARLEQAYGKMPLYFVENQGQLDERVAFYLQGSDKTVYFTPDGVTFVLSAPPQTADRQLPQSEIQHWSVKLNFVGANPNVRPIGQDQTEAVISYFKGPQDQWHAGLPTYSRIIYPDLWPGIDLVYHGTSNQLKSEFIVHPGADPAQIRLAYRGAENVTLNAAGRLEVTTPLGGFTDDTPMAYQETGGQSVPVPVTYALHHDAIHDSPSALYGFQIAPYDPTRPLILDPAILVYCGFIGGSAGDEGHGIAVDGAGNAYVTGWTSSSEATFPVTVGPDLTINGSSYYQTDAFVAKVKVDGTGLIYAGYIGGSGDDKGNGIAVDGAGNAYVTGTTESTQATFPVIVGPDMTYNGNTDAFVAKVRADGTGLVYAGYIGGSNYEEGNGIAVDGAGNAYIIGETLSTEATFPVAVGPDLTSNGNYDVFVTKVQANGTGLVYSGFIGGSNSEWGYGIAVDGAGNAYVTGQTASAQWASFPVTVGPDLTYNDVGFGFNTDAFVAKVRADGTGLAYCGYIGGANPDWGSGIAVDGAGNAYVAGVTSSHQNTFPVAVGPDLTYNDSGYSDAFVAKVKADGTGLDYCGYIGGSDYDRIYGIAVDGAGNAYIAGYTYSTEATFPVTVGPDLTYNGGIDAFVAKVMADGTGLDYCGYIGGSGDDEGYGIAVDGAGNAYVVGRTDSTEASFPVTVGPDLTFNVGGVDAADAFVAKVHVSVASPFALFLPLVIR